MGQQKRASITPSRPNLAGLRLNIEYVNTSRLWAPRRRTRLKRDGLIKELASSIGKIGFNVPVLVDSELGIIAGHARVEAARMLGMEQVPVIRIEHLTKEQIRLFAIFDNRITEQGEWDDDALNLEFEELRLEEPTLDFTDSGFSIGEIDALGGRVKTNKLDDLDRPVEKAKQGPAVSRLGDVWYCDRHRLICGDSTDTTVIDNLMAGEKARMMVSDPPFDLPTRFFSSSGKHANFVTGAGELGGEKFPQFLSAFLDAAKPVMVDGALLFVWMDWRHIAELLAATATSGLAYKQLLVWVKPTAGMGHLYRSAHELCAVFKHGEATALHTVELGKNGRNRSNVLQYPGVRTMRGGKKAMELHPSVKNIAMIADLILDASAPGDAVLDCFGRSGTTLIAAEKTDRTAYLCELSPHYVDTIVRRFNELNGPQATLAATGQSFAEVEAERLGCGKEA